MERELLVFVKNPIAGKVKTRLAATIGKEKALQVYNHLLEHTAKVCGEVNARVSIYFSDEVPDRVSWHRDHFNYYPQKGHHLGERMENAFREAFARGSREVVIIGSDLYDLSEAIIEEAFSLLQHHDAVIGPAKDGGYYLIGLHEIPKEVFGQKKWGSDTILAATLTDLAPYDVVLLRELNDIDNFDDLKAYPDLLQLLNTTDHGTAT
ncbi:TIGR04282 family arsenosugar biosynthesis glycosyltransferase [Robertkochia sediminum]|uniref:TIGR04282 family arsenosugar biosynthesis glycosyltransferase n=1 Tax=Robertkochia sediminum TaxID=2785326 RepID=UPI0019323C38|nr:TIGR04282 family arsenosugar biosynthesis glycosyltransferase [Robertkochia sediminum]MBL7473035.1 TIGR04282 family arsenosugar biosynthesis glycosyltransferase [Robertkochia sediminum]